MCKFILLDAQMIYLEEWSHMDRDYSSSLLGAIEALRASTLRLPVVGGARVCAFSFLLLGHLSASHEIDDIVA